MAERHHDRRKRVVTFAATLARAPASGARAQPAEPRFVWRHRCDVQILTWVHRRATASSALTAALLGISAAAADAELAPFSSVVLAFGNNPIGSYTTSTLGDLDGDGDLDVLMGEEDGVFHYFENIGLGFTVPNFVRRTGAANPLFGIDLGSRSTPVFADLDGDGDLDLVAGDLGSTFRYFENTGNATNAVFVQRTGAANFLDGVIHEVGDFPTPAFGDLDGDGDLDLVAGSNGGNVVLENTGDAVHPAFGAPQFDPALNAPGAFYTASSLADLDSDGDLDLVVGEYSGGFHLFENTGSATSAAFIERTGSASPLNGIDVGTFSYPALGDLDGDGDPDLVAGGDEFVAAYINFAGDLIHQTGPEDPFNGTAPDLYAPTLGDLDDDGDLDLVAGDYAGVFLYFENTGTTTTPAFLARTGFSNPFVLVDVGSRTTPTLGDIDGDGDLDLVSGEASNNGALNYFENTGTTTGPAFIQRTGAANPFTIGFFLGDTAPSLGDLDGDGDLDLLVGSYRPGFRALSYLENIGSSTSPQFVSASVNPFTSIPFDRAAALGDLDGDGDLDVATSGIESRIFENTGGSSSPAFVLVGDYRRLYPGNHAFGDLDADGDVDLVTGELGYELSYFESFVVQSPRSALELTGAANPLAGRDVGALAAPALGDLDADGDPDLIVGEDLGTFLFFENTRSATSPAFTPRTGATNPLTGRDVGDAAAPALADLDGDGDSDLLAGRLAGDFAYFENIGDATTPLFATPLTNPFGLSGVGSDYSAPVFGDLDHDGDLDLVAGRYEALAFFENTGSRTNPAFVERTGSANILGALDTGSYASPAFADFDGDGDLDLVCGGVGGKLRYFQNFESATAFSFTQLTGSANPLSDEDVGQNSAPAAADLNADGTPDVIAGSLSGTFAVHLVPEPGRGLLSGAGLALLLCLDRIRRRVIGSKASDPSNGALDAAESRAGPALLRDAPGSDRSSARRPDDRPEPVAARCDGELRGQSRRKRL